jgi:hypothetical protein
MDVAEKRLHGRMHRRGKHTALPTATLPLFGVPDVLMVADGARA